MENNSSQLYTLSFYLQRSITLHPIEQCPGVGCHSKGGQMRLSLCGPSPVPVRGMEWDRWEHAAVGSFWLLSSVSQTTQWGLATVNVRTWNNCCFCCDKVAEVYSCYGLLMVNGECLCFAIGFTCCNRFDVVFQKPEMEELMIWEQHTITLSKVSVSFVVLSVSIWWYTLMWT